MRRMEGVGHKCASLEVVEHERTVSESASFLKGRAGRPTPWQLADPEAKRPTRRVGLTIELLPDYLSRSRSEGMSSKRSGIALIQPVIVASKFLRLSGPNSSVSVFSKMLTALA